MYSKKKILHLIETVGPGGAETVFAEILGYLKNNDKDNEHIAGFTQKGWIYQYIKNKKHPVVLFNTNKSFDIKLIKVMAKYLKGNQISLIHSHLPDLSLYSSLAARCVGIPHVMTEHGDSSHFSKSWKRLFLKYLILTWSTQKIVCVSKYNKNIIKERFPWCDKKLAVIHNGIRTNGLRDSGLRSDIRKSLDIKLNEIALCNVGNLYPVKGQENLILAIEQIRKSFPLIKLFIIGRGDLENHLKILVTQLKLKNVVHFMGFRKDVNRILAGMDVFVLSSLSEGMPISLIEAMNAGLSIVSTNTGGISEVKDLGGDIILVKNSSARSLSEGIKDLIIKGNLKNENNRNVVKKCFSVEAMAKKYQKIYFSVMKS